MIHEVWIARCDLTENEKVLNNVKLVYSRPERKEQSQSKNSVLQKNEREEVEILVGK